MRLIIVLLYVLSTTGPLKVTVVVGTPIPVSRCSVPSEALVKEVMDTYMRALLAMFERHKLAAGENPERRLVFIESDGKPYTFNDISLEK